MNRKDVATVLTAASYIDPTVPQPSGPALDMWAAMLDDIPADIGTSAVRAYYRSDAYAHDKRTITPGDIVAHWRRVRRDHTDRQALDELAQRRAAIEAAPQPVASLAERFAIEQARRYGTDEHQAATQAADWHTRMQTTCPRCGAQPGQRCTRHDGRPLRKTPAHEARPTEQEATA